MPFGFMRRWGIALVLPFVAALAAEETLKDALPKQSAESGGPLSGASSGLSNQQGVSKTGPDTYAIGNIRIDARAREIGFPAKVNMNDGLIEVVVCSEQGKLHESIFVSPIHPLQLHTALLLLGVKPGRNPGWSEPADASSKPTKSENALGDQVAVFARWQTPEGPYETPVERLLMDVRTKQSLPGTNWVFVGSLLDARGAYVADQSGSLITNYHDRTAVLDNPLDVGRIDDFTFANTALIPKVNTPVWIRVSVAAAKGEKKDE
jgi:hypothetical protein